jgi:glycosyltransferase involved in cell wall biosynthesis
MCVPGFPASNDDADKPFLLDHAKALVACGVHVSVVSPAVHDLPSRQTIDGVEIRRVRYGPRRMETLAATGSMYREARGLKSILVVPMIVALCVATWREARQGAALVYGHWWIPGGLVAVVVGCITGSPSAVHLHGSDAAMTTNRFFETIARWVMRAAAVRLAVSDELATWGEELTGRKFHVLPMPLNFDRLPDSSPVPEEGFVLAVGRLVPEKGFDVLLKAVGSIESASRPPVTIIGIGPERENLVLQARRLEVELHLPGAVSPRDMSDWYRRCRVVAVPSLREGFGLVAAEASAAGRTVVGTRVGGLPQIVDHGVSGLLVEPGDSDAFAEALLTVDPSWGANGPTCVAKFKNEQHGEWLRQLCEELLM